MTDRFTDDLAAELRVAGHQQAADGVDGGAGRQREPSLQAAVDQAKGQAQPVTEQQAADADAAGFWKQVQGLRAATWSSERFR